MPQDFEARDYIPNSGWPIRYADMVPWYRRACETLQLGPFAWNAAARAKAIGVALLPLGPAVDQRYYQFSPPTRFARTYGGVLEQAQNVRVVMHSNVTDIGLESDNARVSSLRCQTLSGTTFHVQANRYVLALGGIENARVLLASRSQQPEGVANGNDVVGRYFMEHPHYYDSVGLVRPTKLDLVFYTRIPSDFKRADGTVVRTIGALGLAADVARREKLLNFSVTFQSVSAKSTTGPLTRAMVQRLLVRGAR